MICLSYLFTDIYCFKVSSEYTKEVLVNTLLRLTFMNPFS